MILIKPNVLKMINEYVQYLISEGLTSNNRAKQKKKEMIQAINSNLGGIVSYRFSPYKGLGKDEDCRLYVYKDSKSRTQWGFGHKEFYDNNVIVYHMKNMKLLKEK